MNSFRDAIPKGRGPGGPVMPAKKALQHPDAGDDLLAVPVPRAESRKHNHRTEHREVAGADQARLFIKRKRYVVDLLNLSGGGAMVRTNVPLKLWDRLHLEPAKGDRVECAVRWIKGDRIGLEFAHETQVAGDASKRDAMLLDTITRSFSKCDLEPAAENGDGEAEPKAEPDAQRRADLRHPLIWTGQILFDFEASPARLRNISELGAMVECVRAIPEGSEVLLDLSAAGQHFAIVNWARGDQMGLRFQQPFDIACLARAKPEVAPERWSRPDYLNAGQDMDSPWAEPWERLTLPELRDSLEGFLKR